ncbi:DUF4230 domain-containing protein [Neobacillus sp. Marseille-QA0830]
MEKEGNLSKAELDYLAAQLKQTEKETASTVAVQPRFASKHRNRLFSLRPWMTGIILGAILAVAAMFAWQFHSQKAGALKSGAAVESIQKLSTLATAKEHIKTIIPKEDNELFGKTISFNFPGSKRTLFMVIPTDVTAGVDLEHLTQKDITLDDKTKTITIKLPHAVFVQDPSIDFKHIQTYSVEGIFRSEANWEEAFELADLAKQKAEKEAVQFGLLKTAETNARLALKDFFKNMGYTVKVSFE